MTDTRPFFRQRRRGRWRNQHRDRRGRNISCWHQDRNSNFRRTVEKQRFDREYLDERKGNDSSNKYSRSLRAKLPKLEVRKFDGKPEQWQEFWDGFENSVHSNPNLSAIDKVRFKQRCTICQSPEVASRSSVKSAKQAGHCLRQWNVWNVSECPQRTTSWECFC